MLIESTPYLYGVGGLISNDQTIDLESSNIKFTNSNDSCDKTITAIALDRFSQSFNSNPKNLLARNCVTQYTDLYLRVEQPAYARVGKLFNHMIKSVGPMTDQKSSGRCWIFAGLNCIRQAVADKYNLSSFQLSQTHLFFYDKLEKANFFLEEIFANLDRPLDDRWMRWNLGSPISDGGFWQWFSNLVQKYGVMPRSAMPDSGSSTRSARMNWILKNQLKQMACEIHQLHASGACEKTMAAKKQECLDTIYRILAINLGEPPKTFDWEYKDKKGNIVSHKDLTPAEFLKEHVPYKVEDKVTIVNAPHQGRAYNQHFRSGKQNNMAGGDPMTFLHMPIEDLKAYTMKAIDAGEPVWYACDVGQFKDNETGCLDKSLFNYELLYGTEFNMTKAQRIAYKDSTATHAMTITGYNTDENGKVNRWKVENSWGSSVGQKGFLIMSDEWFDDYVFEVIIDKKYLPEKTVALLKQPPVELAPWDPMMTVLSANQDNSNCCA